MNPCLRATHETILTPAVGGCRDELEWGPLVPLWSLGMAAQIQRDRRRYNEEVAREAYLLAERRQFGQGRELEDWLTAESVVVKRGR